MDWQELAHATAKSGTFWTAVAAVMTALVSGYFGALGARRKDRSVDKSDAQKQLNESFQLFTKEIRDELLSERTARAAERTEYQLERKSLVERISNLSDEITILKSKSNLILDHVRTLEWFIRREGKEPPRRPKGIDG